MAQAESREEFFLLSIPRLGEPSASSAAKTNVAAHDYPTRRPIIWVRPTYAKVRIQGGRVMLETLDAT